jgi:hypothetical protein
VTTRDKAILGVVAAIVVIGAYWFLLLAPVRKQGADVDKQVVTQRKSLEQAQSVLGASRAARATYAVDYATVARLGKAVPVDDDVPSLVYQLESTAKANHIDFRAIKLTPGSAGPAPTGAAAAVASATGKTAAGSPSTVSSALPPGAAVGPAGFPTMPFSFDFNGSFKNMQKFLRALNGLTTVNGKSISVKGRLLTVDGVGLKASAKGFPDIEATVAVTSYLLPADEGLTAGATAAAPATGSTTATASLIGN